MKILVFDLDDTLYEEITFVYGGFRAVSELIYQTYQVDPKESYQMQVNFLKKMGRGAVFNETLKHYKIYSPSFLKKCISAYRYHNPEISLCDDAFEILEHYRDFSKYLVTDGNKLVQGSKVKALELDKYMKKCFISRRYGIAKEKPSPYCFLKISQMEKASPSDVVYIGDNPNKDFVGIKKLGYRTIRIHRGPFKDKVVSQEYDADFHIHNLHELRSIIEV